MFFDPLGSWASMLSSNNQLLAPHNGCQEVVSKGGLDRFVTPFQTSITLTFNTLGPNNKNQQLSRGSKPLNACQYLTGKTPIKSFCQKESRIQFLLRIGPSLEATFERQNEKYSAVIRKVYPEVRDGKFKADFRFEGQQPENIRAGQTYYMNVQLGQPEEAVIIPRGSFYQATGGKWVYVVNADGTKATKRSVRIGRQNPQYYEVIEGLEPGEKIIISSYDSCGDKDELIIK